jgi:hypothetical protein
VSESVTFWLENRNCAGTKAATIGDQVLVLYRDRYYVVSGGSAQTRGGKPLRFSPSSLPTVWKRALKGEVLPPATPTDPVPTISAPKRERQKTEKPVMSEPQPVAAPEAREKTPQPAKAPKKTEKNAAPQPPLMANCPYCSTRHEIPLEKGRSGKPFFMPCSKCNSEFAVRIVPVTVYQAQVAGFR